METTEHHPDQPTPDESNESPPDGDAREGDDQHEELGDQAEQQVND